MNIVCHLFRIYFYANNIAYGKKTSILIPNINKLLVNFTVLALISHFLVIRQKRVASILFIKKTKERESGPVI